MEKALTGLQDLSLAHGAFAPEAQRQHQAEALALLESLSDTIDDVERLFQRYGIPAEEPERVVLALSSLLTTATEFVQRCQRCVETPLQPTTGITRRCHVELPCGTIWAGEAEQLEDGTWYFVPDHRPDGWLITDPDELRWA
jgi:hypothetical protein